MNRTSVQRPSIARRAITLCSPRAPRPAAAEAIGFLPVGTRLFEYQIEKVLGHGGFGITYLARDTHLDKTVAIKEYLPTDLAFRSGTHVSVRTPVEQEAFAWGLKQFLKEAQTLARFAHPNLIPVHRYFQANQTAYFVMSYVEGETLSSLLKRERGLTEERLRAVLEPVMQGLEAVHRAGILHRDIKPENILLWPDGSPVLIDFGAARLNLGSMTRSVMCALTAGYAPLEQYGTSGNQGPWTDVYALGAVAYRVVSGRKPTDAVNRVHDDPLVPAEMVGRSRYSPVFLRAVDWALAVNPEDRPRSLSEFRLAMNGSRVRCAAPGATQAPVPSLDRASADSVASKPATHTVLDTGVSLAGEVTRLPACKKPAAPSGSGVTSAPTHPWAARSAAAVAICLLSLTIVPMANPRDSQTQIAIAPIGLAETAQQHTTATPQPQPAVIKTSKPAPSKSASVVPGTQKRSREPQLKPQAGVVPVSQVEPLSTFRDCPYCPAMVVLPFGTVRMGASTASDSKKGDAPMRELAPRKAFAMGRYEVTAAQWRECVKAGACAKRGAEAVVGKAAQLPAVNVTWSDARAYTVWLTLITGRQYRLPSEAEWEYAARAGTTTDRFWGQDSKRQCAFANGADHAGRSLIARNANLKVADCNDGQAALAAVGSFRPNWFDLHDTAGNAWEWTQDCWRDSPAGAPRDVKAVEVSNCAARVMRGGSWRSVPEHLRSSSRSPSKPDQRGDNLGFRVLAE